MRTAIFLLVIVLAGTEVFAGPAKPKLKTAPRKPASIDAPVPVEVETRVFDEKTGFEDMVEHRKELERNPASIQAMARVIGVRRELGLTARAADAAPQDLILNGGTAAGISEGMLLSAVRKIPVIDPYRENQQIELEIEFAKVKVIHAQKDVAVARVESLEKPEEGPFVGTRSVLVGDFITTAKR